MTQTSAPLPVSQSASVLVQFVKLIFDSVRLGYQLLQPVAFVRPLRSVYARFMTFRPPFRLAFPLFCLSLGRFPLPEYSPPPFSHLVATQMLHNAGQIGISANGDGNVRYRLGEAWLIHHDCEWKVAGKVG